MRARLCSLLRERVGASLPFVLAIMLLFTALGVSALAAAAAVSGTVTSKQIENQLALYADSLHQSLLYSLQQGETPGGNVDVAATLGGQLMNVLYDRANTPTPPTYYTITVPAVKLGEETLAEGCKLAITIEPNVTIRKTHTETYPTFDADGNQTGEISTRYPQEAYLSANVTISSDIEYRGKQILAASRFAYSGGVLKDDGNEVNMLIQVPGDWRFVSYDKVDR